jgi:hypothetical protein
MIAAAITVGLIVIASIDRFCDRLVTTFRALR